MDNSFFAYLQLMELMIFFSGYAMIYAIIYAVFGKPTHPKTFKSKMVSLLPFAYALVGTLYLGLQLKNLYPDISLQNISSSIHQPYLMIWGLLALLFWIPSMSRITILSLVHSFVFLYFLLKDLFLELVYAATGKEIIKNDMNIYSISLLINLSAFVFIVICVYLLSRFKKQPFS